MLTRITPTVLPYVANAEVFLSGPTGADPGAFINVSHRFLIVTMMGTEYKVLPTFMSKRLLKFTPPDVPKTNMNQTATVRLFYNNSFAGSNLVSCTYGKCHGQCQRADSRVSGAGVLLTQSDNCSSRCWCEYSGDWKLLR